MTSVSHEIAEEHQLLLLEAISQKSSPSKIEQLIEDGASVNGATKKGVRPLHSAVDVKFADCVRLLLLKGADVNLADGTGFTPLLLSASNGCFKVMQMLIDNGAIVNYCGAEGKEVPKSIRDMGYLTYDPLNMAIENNHEQCVKLLLENGAHANKHYYMGYEINLMPSNHLSCLELLLKHGANPNSLSRYGTTPLMKACKENITKAVCLLIQFGANVNMGSGTSFNTKTPLNIAIEYSDFNIVNTLLENGAKVSMETGCTYSPLHTAVLAGRTDVCGLLLSSGASIDGASEDGFSPLMLVVKYPRLSNRLEIMKLLLHFGANPNFCQNNPTYSTASTSVIGEYFKNNQNKLNRNILCLLLKYGGKINIRACLPCGKVDPFGILPYLSDSCSEEILRLLTTTAKCIDRDAIKKSDNLTQDQCNYLMSLTISPHPLMGVVRNSIIESFGRKLTDNNFVDDFEIPTILKKYLILVYPEYCSLL
ncbi:unnamed protein product [Mytilus coruscus]|uniref:Uncharacterized protein n=1 Tax=Mytilus coruscus TaxID=42192 RepID=A0A6J8DHP7_MYTCO|nr:unnamed protein product [Mytilus coruscus]